MENERVNYIEYLLKDITKRIITDSLESYFDYLT